MRGGVESREHVDVLAATRGFDKEARKTPHDASKGSKDKMGRIHTGGQ